MGREKVALFSLELERLGVGIVDAVLGLIGLVKCYRSYAQKEY
jgi:hypothetical protein